MEESIIKLPNEILYLITSYLEDITDLRSLQLSSRCLVSPLNYSLRKQFLYKENYYLMAALFWSAATQNEGMVREILEKGSPEFAVRVYADWEEQEASLGNVCEKDLCQDEEKGTYYFVLGKKPTDNIVQRVLAKGANLLIAGDNYSPFIKRGQVLYEYSSLSLLVEWSSPVKVQQFLEMGADPGLLNSYGCTAFDAVAMHRPLDKKLILRLLHKQEADYYFNIGCGGISPKDIDIEYTGRDGNKPLHLATICSEPIKMVQMVLDAGANINDKNTEHKTALHFAFSYEKTPPVVVKLLIDNGADTTMNPTYMIDSYEWTPQIQEKVAVFLNCMKISYRADDDNTLLHIAVRNRMPIKDIELLLERGVDINAKDHCSQTALHLVAGRGNKELYDFLVKKGADAMIKDEWGCTPADVLATSSSGEIPECSERIGGWEVGDTVEDTAVEVATGGW